MMVVVGDGYEVYVCVFRCVGDSSGDGDGLVSDE